MKNIFMKRFFTLLLIIATIGILSYCIFRIRAWVLADPSLLTGTPCAAPCWQNIVPGATTSYQAIELIESSQYITKNSVRLSGTMEDGGCIWKWQIPGSQMDPGMWWSNEIVQEIRLDLTYQIVVENIISKYGFPEAVNVHEGGNPESWNWIVDLFYTKLGLQFKAFLPKFTNNLEPSTKIDIAYLFIPTSLEERVQYLYPDLNFMGSGKLINWEGYGNIEEKYRPYP